MKILKRGTNPEEDLYRGTCYKCKTEIEIQRKEGRYQEALSQRDESYVSYTCPVCGGSIGCKKRNDGAYTYAPSGYHYDR